METSIILINGRFLTQPIAGVQRYAMETSLALSRLKCQILIVAPRGRLLRTLPYVVQDTSPLTGHAWEQIRLPILVKKYNANLLWCPCYSGPVTKIKVPLVVNIYDASFFAGPEWFSKTFRLIYQRLIPKIGQKAHRVVTCSKFSKAELIKYGIAREDKIEVIYAGVDHINPEFNTNYHLNELSRKIQGKRYILILGSMDPRKNVNRLLDAWNRLPGKLKEGRVLVVTGGQYAAFAKEIISEPKEDIIFSGFIPDKQLPALYKHADLFVFPSLYEGFGFPPLEAMSCGTPTLVSATGSLPEVCGNAALYCDPYNVDDISTKIAELLTDHNLREELQKRGFELIKKYTWGKAAREIITLFQEVLAKGYRPEENQ